MREVVVEGEVGEKDVEKVNPKVVGRKQRLMMGMVVGKRHKNVRRLKRMYMYSGLMMIFLGMTRLGVKRMAIRMRSGHLLAMEARDTLG